MNLGRLMKRLEDESDAAEALAALGDIRLFAAVVEMGERYEETPAEYVANASRRFASLASGEDWMALMTAMDRAEDPGKAALSRMLDWSLARDGETTKICELEGSCSCGGRSDGGSHGHDPA